MVLIPQGTGRVGRRRGLFLNFTMLNKIGVLIVLLLGISVMPLCAQDLPLFVNQGTEFSFEHRLFYNDEKQDLNFDTRGRLESRNQMAGASLSYVVAQTIQIGIDGGVLIDPEISNSASTYRGRSGYFYGLEVADHIFPATNEWKPGITAQLGISSHVSFFDRQQIGNTEPTIDQKMQDLQYGGSVVASWKLGPLTPYFGPRVTASDVKWVDNQPQSGSPSSIEGHLDKNIGIVAGCSFSIMQGLELQLEGRALGETSIRASIQWLKY
jgi:hypothetical protein